jgi:hypothetical protein
MKTEAERRLLGIAPVRIELTSTLTQEDENRLAPAVLKLLAGILEMLPVASMVRIETTDEHVFQQLTPEVTAWEPAHSSPPAELARPLVEG